MRVTDQYVFFWGNADIYSNWHPARFRMDNHTFANSEQAMMYEKAQLMGDTETAAKILKTPNPKAVKALGREVRFWNENLWETNRVRIMVKVCLAKFKSNSELTRQLLETGKRVIVEASPYDKIWGIGMRENDEGVENPKNWQGLNLLGVALMEVREILYKEQWVKYCE